MHTYRIKLKYIDKTGPQGCYIIKFGKNVDGKDWDHKDGRWESVARNRANDGEGTKKEGKNKYKVPKRK